MTIHQNTLIAVNDNINSQEILVFHQTIKENQAFYIFSFNYDDQETTLHHYNNGNKDILFSKTYDFLFERPNLENRHEIFQKFHRWMTFS